MVVVVGSGGVVGLGSVARGVSDGVGVFVGEAISAKVGDGVLVGVGVVSFEFGAARLWLLPRKLFNTSSPAMIQLTINTMMTIMSNGSHNCRVRFVWVLMDQNW